MSDYIIENIRLLNKEAIVDILQYKGEEQQKLFETARTIRNNGRYKNKVELRSVIELSNICSQKCKYCSIANGKDAIYTMDKESILKNIITLANMGRLTFLLQSGENHNQKFIEDIAYCCKEVKKLFPDIRLILCLGNLSYDQYKLLKDSGVSRYILKFEIADSEYHRFCRPADSIENRLEHIQMLSDLGYQVGSGNIVGLPEQTFDHLYKDLQLINELDLSMVSATRFVSNPLSVFKDYPCGDIDLTLNFLSVLRILKPDALIPSTTSLAVSKEKGQANGLMAGCNTITIHDGTPEELEQNYSIYSQNRFVPREQYCRDIIEQCDMIPVKYLL